MLIHSKEMRQLYCWAWNRVYVKANGRVPCWCDNGESHTVIHADMDKCDFVRDVVNSYAMRQMRIAIIYNNEYYINECDDCCCIMESTRGGHARFDDTTPVKCQTIVSKKAAAQNQLKRVRRQRKWPLGSIDKIAELQIEPAFPCNLACPACIHGRHSNPLETESPPYILSFSRFQRIVDALSYNDIKLLRMSFVGRGEPTLNEELPDMITYVRTVMPAIKLTMDTNATHAFKPEYLNLDLLNCSIDGSTPESYSTYRRNGTWDKTIQFMRNAAKYKRESNKRCLINWKYILFDTTDNIQLLDGAQRLATELNIDRLEFVLTNCGASDGSVKPSQELRTLQDVQSYINSSKIFPHTIASHAT